MVLSVGWSDTVLGGGVCCSLSVVEVRASSPDFVSGPSVAYPESMGFSMDLSSYLMAYIARSCDVVLVSVVRC